MPSVSGPEAQQKFEFYVVGLIFTILAASIHTATFGVSLVSDAFELLAWALLLAAGFLGLWRLQWMPIVHTLHATGEGLAKERFDLQHVKASGERSILVADTGRVSSLDEQIENREKSIARVRTRYGEIEARLLPRYTAARVFFIPGATSLVLARGYIPACNLAKGIHAIMLR